MSHPSIRTLSGLRAVAHLEAASTALIVIDFQMEYFNGAAPGKLPIPDGPKAMAQANRLIAFADAHDMPVIHIQHLGAAGSALFAAGSAFAEFHPDISPAPHHVVVQKTTASSFASTDLHQRLQAQGIKTLIVCGLMTHMCISTTTRDARPLGYQVIVAADACATRDIAAWDGRDVVAHADIHRATLTALSDNFADVLVTSRIVELEVQSNLN